MAKLFKYEKPAVVCSTLAYFNFVIIIALILSGHRPSRIILREANGPSSTLATLPAKWIGKLGYKFLYNRADVVICNALHVSQELKKLGVKSELVELIRNPVDEREIRALAKETVCLPHFCEETLPLFVAVGRLAKQKGMDRLIDWISAMETDANLLIIGDGPDYPKLVAQIKRKNLGDRVVIMKFQSNPYPFMARADAILLGSRWEGLPNVALEAFALGKRVIASSACKSLAEISSKGNTANIILAREGDDFVIELENIVQSAKKQSAKRKSLLPSTLADEFQVHNVVAKYRTAIFGG